MREIIKNYFAVAISALFFIFCMNYIFASPIGDELRKQIGSIFRTAKKEDTKSQSYLLLEEMLTATAPKVKYVGGTKNVGDVVEFKELIEVCLIEDSYKLGTEEDGFYIYFQDIFDKNGVSVVTYLNENEIDALEEIPTAFIFDKERQSLFFYKSGIFVMSIKIYTDDGISNTYEFSIPVEVS